MSGTIPLFWYSIPRFGRGDRENFGDLLSRYLVEKISGRKAGFTKPDDIRWYEVNKRVYFASGSILHLANRKTIVWGSGMIKRTGRIKRARFLAVRGPVTREILLKQGHDVPEVYGDPAILIPDIYHPPVEKNTGIGLIPHFVDYEKVKDWYEGEEAVQVVDLLNNEVEPVLDQILGCRMVVTSSLHGLIVSHTYGIPAVWVQFSDKLYGDNMKFEDYLTSVGINFYQPEFISERIDPDDLKKRVDLKPSLPDFTVMEQLRKGLMEVCPFKKELPIINSSL